jgi:hypothetical protein
MHDARCGASARRDGLPLSVVCTHRGHQNITHHQPQLHRTQHSDSIRVPQQVPHYWSAPGRPRRHSQCCPVSRPTPCRRWGHGWQCSGPCVLDSVSPHLDGARGGMVVAGSLLVVNRLWSKEQGASKKQCLADRRQGRGASSLLLLWFLLPLSSPRRRCSRCPPMQCRCYLYLCYDAVRIRFLGRPVEWPGRLHVPSCGVLRSGLCLRFGMQ